MQTYPAARLLVPATAPALADDFQVVESPLVKGLPHFVDIAKGLRLKITLPTGLLQAWLDADPTDLVATSDREAAPYSATGSTEPGSTSRPALRLTGLDAAESLGTVPFALHARQTLRRDGDAIRGARIEVVLLDWRIFAGTVRGIGDFGSRITLAWRLADAAVDAFGPPVINPFLWHRLEPLLRIESELGLRKAVIGARFLTRRFALHG